MAGSVNKVILVGNLGADPEVRNAQSGAKIVTFTMATSESWKDRTTGERREKTEWHRIVVFNERIGENAERYLHKGDKIYLEGDLQTRKWTDQSGNERYTTEIVVDQYRGEVTFLTPKRDDGTSGDDRPSRQARQRVSGDATRTAGGEAGGWEPGNSDLDDAIPF